MSSVREKFISALYFSSLVTTSASLSRLLCFISDVLLSFQVYLIDSTIQSSCKIAVQLIPAKICISRKLQTQSLTRSHTVDDLELPGVRR